MAHTRLHQTAHRVSLQARTEAVPAVPVKATGHLVSWSAELSSCGGCWLRVTATAGRGGGGAAALLAWFCDRREPGFFFLLFGIVGRAHSSPSRHTHTHTHYYNIF